ncbi:MAG: PilZ domain-containing protein [Sphingomonas sp.]|uniref:PilZ domain-containing protein n=1 Tax=Sphingomonas sp. TaxID=28214 RepID=UPI001AC4C1BC|nr:PilZ domain-containing protein [Sphingomonas sp.]MBN8807409.1 PilZ domain-containing protein [Sphingomonas sp.]
MIEARPTNIRADYAPADAHPLRKSARATVSLDAKLVRGGLDRTACRITDLSPEGARLSSYSALKKDTTISLTLPGIGQVAAVVRWADDFQAGCQFVSPLTMDQFEELVGLGAI